MALRPLLILIETGLDFTLNPLDLSYGITCSQWDFDECKILQWGTICFLIMIATIFSLI